MKLVGPSLVVVPLSVLTAWLREFRRWSPSMRVVRLHSSNADERERIKVKCVHLRRFGFLKE